MDWDKLKTFHAAAEAGSLTAAADQLRISQSAVSRQIAALEESLGVTLFHRHPRGLLPTEQGRLLFETTHDIAARVSLAENALLDSRDKPSGDLHVTAPVALGTVWLAPRLKPFVDRFPEIALQLLLDDAELDLSSFEVEAAIRLWRPTQGDIIAKKLMTVRQSLYAGPSYLAERAAPRTPGDLEAHPLVLYGADGSPMRGVDWARDLVAGGRPPAGSIKVNSVIGVKAAIEAGLGVGSLPDYLVRGAHGLVRVLPDHHGPEFDVFFCYPEELRGSRRIGVLRDFLVHIAREFNR